MLRQWFMMGPDALLQIVFINNRVIVPDLLFFEKMVTITGFLQNIVCENVRAAVTHLTTLLRSGRAYGT